MGQLHVAAINLINQQKKKLFLPYTPYTHTVASWLARGNGGGAAIGYGYGLGHRVFLSVSVNRWPVST